jgi:hypothetical protein
MNERCGQVAGSSVCRYAIMHVPLRGFSTFLRSSRLLEDDDDTRDDDGDSARRV